jgi:hypothetical protein
MNFTLATDAGELNLTGEVTGIGDYNAVAGFSEILEIYGMRCPVLTIDGLVKCKEALSRPKDKILLAELKALREIRLREANEG